ncbi:MAG: arylesterase [Rhodothermales bacterium]|nr:arylesterase [Rhodothermales bacterium]
MMSKAKPLYRLTLLCVLLTMSCTGEERENSQVSESTADAVTAPVAGTATAEGDRSAATGEKTPESEIPRILVLGNSITAGYGLPPEQAFPALLQARIDAAGYNYEVVNAGLSGETTAGGRRRIEWLLRRDAEVLVIELGGNDGLRGTDPSSMSDNLLAIIETARASNPEMRIVLGGMRMPMNMGGAYREEFESVYPEVADQTDVVLIPHILEGVGGVPSMNQPDGIHPTAEGQEIIAETVWQYLEPLLAKEA